MTTLACLCSFFGGLVLGASLMYGVLSSVTGAAVKAVLNHMGIVVEVVDEQETFDPSWN